VDGLWAIDLLPGLKPKEAARQLNIDVLTLDRWIEKYGLK
jgi:hypothetical protein